MISYTHDQLARLRRDPMAEFDAEHEAFIEVLTNPPDQGRDINQCLRSRSRWRRLDALRTQRTFQRIAKDSQPTDNRCDPAYVVEHAELQGQVTRALAKLPPHYRRILHARYFVDRRLREIAIELGCTPQSVHNQEKRALKHLRPLLSSLWRD